MMTTIVLICSFAFPIIYVAFRYSPQFGIRPNKSDIDKYSKSKNWKKGKFQNLQPTSIDVGIKKAPKLLKEQFTGRAEREPKLNIPIRPFNTDLFNNENGKAKFIWYGHSVLLMRLDGKNFLIDPMFGQDASPIAPFKVKRFSKNSLEQIDGLPNIDAIIFTHDHYDHLDLASMRKLIPNVSNYIVALGVGRHLVRWGVPSNQITEMDWWDTTVFEGVKITFTPSRHFTGRGTSDRAKSLWGGYVFEGENENIYWSGDGGFGDHFKTISDHFNGFDIAFMESGQYNKMWHQIHMYPEEAVEAGKIVNAKTIVPVHWAGFSLATHHWVETIDRFVTEAKTQNQDYKTPLIGDVFECSSEMKTEWWTQFT